MHSWTKLIGGILLVAGTTIGAAILALPISMGIAGYLPSVLLFVFFWIFMAYTSLLFLEVNTWTGQGTNLITMATRTLGKPGFLLCWSAYLFLLYALMTAYIAGSGALLNDFLVEITGFPPLGILCAIPLLLIFALLLLRGTAHLDHLNRYLMICLVISYFTMVFVLGPFISFEKLERVEWSYTFTAVSVVATSFGFHIIIPSLYNYFHADTTALKKTLVIGSFIPFLVYLIWQTLALGIIPIHSLQEGYAMGANAATLIAPAIGSQLLASAATTFSFFAIATSLIGVALSLCDFLADGLKIQRNLKGNLLIIALAFIPPFIIAATNPRAFLTALEAAGAFGVVVLLALMPALMVWRGRYHQMRESRYKAPGGKPALIATIICSLLIISLEIANKIGWLPQP